jgi:hypothetical protein
MDDKRYLKMLATVFVVSLVVCGATVLASVCRGDDLPDLLPSLVPTVAPPCCPNGICPVKKPAVLELRYEVKEAAKDVAKAAKKTAAAVRGLVKVPCPNCPSGFYTRPETDDEMAARVLVDKFAAASLTKEEVLEAKAKGLAGEVRKVIGQRWSEGTCRMACVSGGSVLYDLFNDGTEEPAKVQPAVAPEEGVHSSGGGWRLFGRRR